MIKGYIAVDMDGTICEHRFPEIGPEIPGAIDMLKRLKLAGWRLILFTVREDLKHGDGRMYLTEAVLWCEKQGLKFDAINCTPTEYEPRIMGGGRKVMATHFIDDRNIGGMPTWEEIGEMLIGGEE